MRKRRLGKTELELTTVGLGTWAIGGPWQFGWGPQDDQSSISAIQQSIEEGVNWIDTAPIYGCGHSEEIVGKALKQVRSKPIIATKCGLLWNKDRQKINIIKYDSVIRECEDSLRRLDVEAIDLYQIHWPEPDEDIEQAWEAMVRLREAGKIRYLGVSNFSVSQMERIGKIAPVDSMQLRYNVLHREIENEQMAYAEENGIGLVVYTPMERGLLTGKFDQKRLSELAPDDHRLKSPEFKEPMFSATLELVEKLKPVAADNRMTLAQLAIVWTLRRDEVTSAIVGARKPEQIKETAKAMDLELPGRDIAKIEEYIREFEMKTK